MNQFNIAACASVVRRLARLQSNFLFVLALAAAQPAQAQAVVRCTDAAGNATYQSAPCPAQSQVKQLPQEKRGALKEAGMGRPAPTGYSHPISDARVDAPAPAAPGFRPDASLPSASQRPAPSGAETQRPMLPALASAALPPQPQKALVETLAPNGDYSKLGEGLDVLVVSGYELASPVTRVQVSHPGKPVLLVLSSYKPTEWQVRALPGTKIKAVIAAASESRPPVLTEPGVLVMKTAMPYSYQVGDAGFRSLVAQLNAQYGVAAITGFKGEYRLPDSVVMVGPYPKDPNFTLGGIRPEKASVSLSFDLIGTDGRRLPWTNAGPKDGKRYVGVVQGGSAWERGSTGALAVDAAGQQVYALEGNGSSLVWYPQGPSQPSKKIAIPKDLPELSWGSAMAWNTGQGVLAIVSIGGEGHFYRYDTRNQRWLGARSLQNRDLIGLGFNASTGGFVGLTNSAELVVFGERGDLEEVHALQKLLPDLASVSGEGSHRLEGFKIAAEGDTVALVHVRAATVTHIWTYDLARRKAQLTYKAQ